MAAGGVRSSVASSFFGAIKSACLQAGGRFISSLSSRLSNVYRERRDPLLDCNAVERRRE